jgi:peptidoglycan/LPS O-acetylase OafA/YrhL
MHGTGARHVNLHVRPSLSSRLKSRLPALDGIRAYAALLVFCVHFFGLYGATVLGVNTDNAEWKDLTGAGAKACYFLAHSTYGVDLFFILSGYLIAHLLASRETRLGTFLWHRFLRVYPAFLLSLLIAAGIGVRWFGHELTPSGLMANLFFLNGLFDLGVKAYNPVTWSLFFEASFYLLAAVLQIVYPRVFQTPLAAVAFGTLISTVLVMIWPTQNAIFFAYFAFFFCGVWLRTIRSSGVATYLAKIPAALVIGIWIAFVIMHGTHTVHNRMPGYYVFFAIAGTLLVGSAIYRHDSIITRTFSNRVLAWLGRISYSLYLVHYLVIHVTFYFLRDRLSSLHEFSQFMIYAVITFALSLCSAMLLYRATEHYYFKRAH